MELKDDLRYKKFILKREIANIVFLKKMIEDTITFFKENSIEDQINNTGTTKRIFSTIIKGNADGLIDLSDPADYFIDITVIDELCKDYPEDVDELTRLFRITQELVPFSQVTSPIAVSFMELLSSSRNWFEPKSYETLENCIAELLRAIPYKKDSEERKFLSSRKVKTLNWYNAYMFENPSVPVSEHSFLLEELLTQAQFDKNSISTQLTQHINRHLSFEGCHLSLPVAVKLLEAKKISSKLATTLVSKSNFEKKSRKSMTEVQLIDEAFDGLQNEEDRYQKIKTLFESLFFASPIKNWLEHFTDKLVLLSDGDSIADLLLEYLKLAYSKPTPALFEDAYLSSKYELQGKRTDLVLVLESIKKQKSE